MANVLPQKERKRFQREYALRLGVVVLVLVIISAVFCSILLVPSFFMSILKEESIARQSELINKAIAIREKDASTASLLIFRQKLNALKEIQEQVLQTDVIETIARNTNDSVVVDALYYTKGSDATSQVKVSGRARSRTMLITFADNLNQEHLFTSVDLPVSNLAKDSNIVFSMTLTGEF
ncbi:MAG: PilN domain-containing protein [Candidatus Pacebacteria bacterium]|nr:PilN domain-containing protein [Candidatus Paceibacterota bacterium]